MADHPKDASRTPVTILTGFLGSGKTTVLNALLPALGRANVGVIENEFGDIGIDNQLLVGVEERFVELANGCLCCTVRGDIIRILHQWLDQGIALDRVIIETTGIADPGPIVETFAADARLRDRFSVDGIVTVVDALNVEVQIEETFEARQQIAYADRLIVNKVSSLDVKGILRLQGILAELNPLALQVLSADGIVAPDFMFGTVRSHVWPAPAPIAGARGHSDIQSVSLELPGEVNAARFYRWMGDLLAFRSSRLYRLKGILAVEGQDRRIIAQGVRDQIRFTFGTAWANTSRQSQLVFIGKEMEQIRRCCQADANPFLSGVQIPSSR